MLCVMLYTAFRIKKYIIKFEQKIVEEQSYVVQKVINFY